MKTLKNGDIIFGRPTGIIFFSIIMGWILFCMVACFVSFQDKKLLPIMLSVGVALFVVDIIAIMILSKIFSQQNFIVSPQGVQFPGKGKVYVNWDQIKTIHYKERKTYTNAIARQSELLVFETTQQDIHEWELTGISLKDRQLLFRLFEGHNLPVQEHK